MAKLRASSVCVSRLKAGPKQYENERIEVTVEIPADKTAAEGVALGRAFIAKQFGETPKDTDVAAARALIAQHEMQSDL